MKRKPRNWIKLWEDWRTTPSHERLSFEALWGGAGILLLANRGDEDEEGTCWLREPDGAPMDVASLALSLRCQKRLAQDIVASLCAVGTLTRRGEEIGIPKYRRYQEDPSAYRKRKSRDSARDSERDIPEKVTPTVTREERRERKEEGRDTPPLPPSRGKARQRSALTEAERLDCETLFSAMSELLREYHGIERAWSVCPSNTPHVLKRLRGGVTVERLILGFKARCLDAIENEKMVQFLDESTPFRDSKWARTETLIVLMEQGRLGSNGAASAQFSDRELGG